MILPDLLVVAPLVVTTGLVPLILKADTIREQQSFHPLDAADPAGWNRSREWLSGAPIQKVLRLRSQSPSSSAYVAEHSSGQWRTLQRHGSVQSVTLMQPRPEDDGDNDDEIVPFHSSVGNEYLKVMASAYAALSLGNNEDERSEQHARQQQIPAPSRRQHETNQHSDNNSQLLSTLSSSTALLSSSPPSSVLHLGLGGGTLPMLIGEPCTAIELDEDAVDLAIEFCGLDPELVSIKRGGDALDHRRLAPGPHSCVFVDVFGRDNNVPAPFAEEEFVRGLWDSLDEETGGLVIANFHCNGRKEEDMRLQQAKQTYCRVFNSSSNSNNEENTGGGSSSSNLIMIPSRYQGNMILCARKEGKNKNGDAPRRGLSTDDLDMEAARSVARDKGWMFDPGARLEKAETVSFR